MPIRLKLTLWYTGMLGLVLACFAVLAYLAIARQLSSQLEYAIHWQAVESSRDEHASPAARATAVPPSSSAFAASPFTTGVFVRLLDTRGGVLAVSENLRDALPIPPDEFRAALAGVDSHRRIDQPGQRFDLYSAPLIVDGEVRGVLQVAAPLRALEEGLSRLRLTLGGVVLAAILLASGIGWFLSARAMRPVGRMVEYAREIGASGDTARRLPKPRSLDELGRLSLTINEMLARIDETMNAQRHFLADVSHELRTPLAAIRTNIDSLRRPSRGGQAVRAETIRAIGREVDRMARLVGDLLAMARADAGHPLDRRPVAIDRILLDVYRQQKALTQGVRLVLGSFDQAEVEGDAERLRQLIANLVDNALRHTPREGIVTLDLSTKDQDVVVCVRDTGPGIAPEHLPHIFERFYRYDPPGSTGGGAGLGLAICKWIAEAHGGRIDVVSRAGTGTEFRVSLPKTCSPRQGPDSVCRM